MWIWLAGTKLELLFSVAAIEAVYSTCDIDELLLACVKRMTSGTNVQSYVFYCGEGFKLVSTSTLKFRHECFWMYFFLHFFLPDPRFCLTDFVVDF